MSEFDYGNARVRGMKSRLLSSTQLEMLADAHTLTMFTSELARTAYRTATERATVTQASGIGRIGVLLHDDLVMTLGKLTAFYKGSAQRQVAFWLSRYDVHNLKVILHGISQNISPEEMILAIIPVGDLSSDVLNYLMEADDGRAVVDTLITLEFAIARPLLDLRSRHPGASIRQMAHALDCWYFDEAERQADEFSPVLRNTVATEADILNMMTMLRFAHAPAERERLDSIDDYSALEELLVGAGTLKSDRLLQVGLAPTVADGVRILESTSYKPALQAGLKDYKKHEALTIIETHLRRFQRKLVERYITQDVLGMGVPLGYITLKEREVRTLIQIAWGIHLGQSNTTIKSALEGTL